MLVLYLNQPHNPTGTLMSRDTKTMRARHAHLFEWARPVAGPVPRAKGVVDVDRFCERLVRLGVLLLPGSVHDEPGRVPVGFGRANLPEALDVLESAFSGLGGGASAGPSARARWPRSLP